MALGPKQMGEAILRNLKGKTGKDIHGWISIVKSSGLTEKKEVLSYLKAEHGLGHFQAQKVFEAFSNVDPYDEVDGFVDLIFDTKHTKEIFLSLGKEILKLGNDVRVQPCRTYIPFYRKNQFAIISAKGAQVILGANLQNGNSSFQPAKNIGGSSHINYQATIKNITDVDRELIDIIQESYKRNG